MKKSLPPWFLKRWNLLGIFLFLLTFCFVLINPKQAYADLNTSGQIVSNPFGKCIDLSGNNRTDETPVQLYDCLPNNNAQRWEYSSSTRRITLMDDSSKCLDLNHNYQNDGEKIKIMPCTSNNPAQEWFVTADGQIQLYSNRTVCIDAYANYSGAKVYLYHCHGGANQKWYFSNRSVLNSNKEGSIKPNSVGIGGGCIDLLSGGISEGNFVALRGCEAGSLSQQWFYDAGTRQIRLEIDRNKCIALEGSQSNTTRLKLTSCRSYDPNQRWVVDGSSIKLDFNRNFCIDNDTNSDGGQRMSIYGCHGGYNQQWKIELSELQVTGEGALKLKDSNKVIDAPTRNNLDRVHLWDLHDYNLNQIWEVSGSLIKLKGTNKCMNVPYRTQGTEVTVYNCSTTDDGQKFKLIGDRLKLDGTNLCVDSISRNNDGKIHLWECNGDNPNQRWMIVKRTPPPTCSFSDNKFCGEYYDGVTFPRNPKYIQETSNIDFNWGNSSPTGLPTDNFLISWKGRFNFESSAYRFKTTSDDGVKILVDGKVVVDGWKEQGPTEYIGTINLTPGYHTVQVDYYEKAGGAIIKVSWEKFDVLTEHFTVSANNPTSDMNREGGTNTYRNPNRDVFIKYASTSYKRTSLYDGTSKVWIVSHGWNNDSDTLGELADEIVRKNPNDYVLIPDWSSISKNGAAWNLGNFIVAQWIIPTSNGLYDRLNKWGLTNAHTSKINIVGHSFGTYISAELANKYKNADRNSDASNKVASLVALDPAADSQGDSYPFLYDFDGNTDGFQGPVDFYKTAKFTRSFVSQNCTQIKAGSLFMAKTAHEALLVDYQYDPENNCFDVTRRHTQPRIAFEAFVRNGNYLGISNLNYLNEFSATRGKGVFDGKITVTANSSCTVSYSLLNYGSNLNNTILNEDSDRLCIRERLKICESYSDPSLRPSYCSTLIIV